MAEWIPILCRDFGCVITIPILIFLFFIISQISRVCLSVMCVQDVCKLFQDVTHRRLRKLWSFQRAVRISTDRSSSCFLWKGFLRNSDCQGRHWQHQTRADKRFVHCLPSVWSLCIPSLSSVPESSVLLSDCHTVWQSYVCPSTCLFVRPFFVCPSPYVFPSSWLPSLLSCCLPLTA